MTAYLRTAKGEVERGSFLPHAGVWTEFLLMHQSPKNGGAERYRRPSTRHPREHRRQAVLS